MHGVERRVERLARMSGNHQESGRQAAVRNRNAGQLRRGHGGRHTRNDLARDSRPRQLQRFLSATAEHEGVATLQPHDALALSRRPDHQPVNRFLPDARAAGAFANTEALGVGQPAQCLGIDQRVVEHQVGFLDALQPANGPELRVARPCANE